MPASIAAGAGGVHTQRRMAASSVSLASQRGAACAHQCTASASPCAGAGHADRPAVLKDDAVDMAAQAAAARVPSGDENSSAAAAASVHVQRAELASSDAKDAHPALAHEGGQASATVAARFAKKPRKR